MDRLKDISLTILAALSVTLIFALMGAVLGVVLYVIITGIGFIFLVGVSQALINCVLIFGGIFAAYALTLVIISLVKGEL